MTYVVHVWDQPVPATLDGAVSIHERLSDAPASSNPTLEDYARRLLARHPVADEGGVWSDSSLVHAPHGPVLSFGVLTKNLTEVLPFVVATAQTLGLVVLDEQAGAAYLPDGWALTSAGRQRLELKTPDPARVTLADLAPAPLPPAAPYTLHVIVGGQHDLGDAAKHVAWAALVDDPVAYIQQEIAKTFSGRREFYPWQYSSPLRVDFARFCNLAKRLNQRFADVPPPWSDGQPLDESRARLVQTLVVSAKRSAEIRPLVFEAAALQGLHVYDPQAQLIVYPSSSFIRGKDWHGVEAGRQEMDYSESRAGTLIESVCKPALSSAGFPLVNGKYGPVFLREHGGVTHEVRLTVKRTYNGAVVGLQVIIEIQPPAIVNNMRAWPADAKDRPRRLFRCLNLSDFIPADKRDCELAYDASHHGYGVYSDTHVERLGAWLCSNFQTHAVPVLARCTSLTDIDAVLSGPEAVHSPWAATLRDQDALVTHLWIAWLARSANFDALLQEGERFWAVGTVEANSSPHEWRRNAMSRLRQELDRLIALAGGQDGASTSPA